MPSLSLKDSRSPASQKLISNLMLEDDEFEEGAVYEDEDEGEDSPRPPRASGHPSSAGSAPGSALKPTRRSGHAPSRGIASGSRTGPRIAGRPIASATPWAGAAPPRSANSSMPGPTGPGRPATAPAAPPAHMVPPPQLPAARGNREGAGAWLSGTMSPILEQHMFSRHATAYDGAVTALLQQVSSPATTGAARDVQRRPGTVPHDVYRHSHATPPPHRRPVPLSAPGGISVDVAAVAAFTAASAVAADEFGGVSGQSSPVMSSVASPSSPFRQSIPSLPLPSPRGSPAPELPADVGIGAGRGVGVGGSISPAAAADAVRAGLHTAPATLTPRRPGSAGPAADGAVGAPDGLARGLSAPGLAPPPPSAINFSLPPGAVRHLDRAYGSVTPLAVTLDSMARRAEAHKALTRQKLLAAQLAAQNGAGGGGGASTMLSLFQASAVDPYQLRLDLPGTPSATALGLSWDASPGVVAAAAAAAAAAQAAVAARIEGFNSPPRSPMAAVEADAAIALAEAQAGPDGPQRMFASMGSGIGSGWTVASPDGGASPARASPVAGRRRGGLGAWGSTPGTGLLGQRLGSPGLPPGSPSSPGRRKLRTPSSAAEAAVAAARADQLARSHLPPAVRRGYNGQLTPQTVSDWETITEPNRRMMQAIDNVTTLVRTTPGSRGGRRTGLTASEGASGGLPSPKGAEATSVGGEDSNSSSGVPFGGNTTARARRRYIRYSTDIFPELGLTSSPRGGAAVHGSYGSGLGGGYGSSALGMGHGTGHSTLTAGASAGSVASHASSDGARTPAPVGVPVLDSPRGTQAGGFGTASGSGPWANSGPRFGYSTSGGRRGLNPLSSPAAALAAITAAGGPVAAAAAALPQWVDPLSAVNALAPPAAASGPVAAGSVAATTATGDGSGSALAAEGSAASFTSFPSLANTPGHASSHAPSHAHAYSLAHATAHAASLSGGPTPSGVSISGVSIQGFPTPPPHPELLTGEEPNDAHHFHHGRTHDDYMNYHHANGHAVRHAGQPPSQAGAAAAPSAAAPGTEPPQHMAAAPADGRTAAAPAAAAGSGIHAEHSFRGGMASGAGATAVAAGAAAAGPAPTDGAAAERARNAAAEGAAAGLAAEGSLDFKPGGSLRQRASGGSGAAGDGAAARGSEAGGSHAGVEAEGSEGATPTAHPATPSLWAESEGDRADGPAADGEAEAETEEGSAAAGSTPAPGQLHSGSRAASRASRAGSRASQSAAAAAEEEEDGGEGDADEAAEAEAASGSSRGAAGPFGQGHTESAAAAAMPAASETGSGGAADEYDTYGGGVDDDGMVVAGDFGVTEDGAEPSRAAAAAGPGAAAAAAPAAPQGPVLTPGAGYRVVTSVTAVARDPRAAAREAEQRELEEALERGADHEGKLKAANRATKALARAAPAAPPPPSSPPGYSSMRVTEGARPGDGGGGGGSGLAVVAAPELDAVEMDRMSAAARALMQPAPSALANRLSTTMSQTSPASTPRSPDRSPGRSPERLPPAPAPAPAPGSAVTVQAATATGRVAHMQDVWASP
ncbi:hypothetical protein HYH03_005940 [Edaphochlamys debaryana]|uniref:Uncharacterized protein n=1 Tax=Edaphochlamys debaryana TaxID=47281 RepID=A0A836C1V8_9CHLO|nr:hypothetical protein HYH03_005940 [Edaphochlamys debaryana]|eukprot:KAG2496018.1 hypothetical protein HYH03_005940 [Edaphochlamys debaryana]